jgi:hypothetical protein
MTRRDLLNVVFNPACQDTKVHFDYSRQGIAAVLTQDERIVRVWGRACSRAESRCPPVKGEMLAFREMHRQFRYLLKSLQHP